MLQMAYTYEYEGSGMWLNRALQYIDTYFLDVAGLRHLVTPQDNDGANMAFQLLCCGPIDLDEASTEKSKRALAWLAAELNDMADKMLGTRDLNIFYLPTMGERNLLENSEYLACVCPKITL